MKNKTQLIKALSDVVALTNKDSADSIHQIMRRKVSKLFSTHEAFKVFLLKQTAFLPKHVSGMQRWYYYMNGDTNAHICTCGKFIEEYKDKYCCHGCSTKVSTGAKRGPKIDLGKCEEDLRTSLKNSGYKIVKFRHKMSTFKHSCGNVFDASNYAIKSQRVSCQCLHKKILMHSLSTYKEKYKGNPNWLPVKYDAETKTLTCKNKHCGHKISTTNGYLKRCTVCKPKNATRVKTHQEYKDWLRTKRPELQLVGKYIDSRTSTKYKHIECGNTFMCTPSGVTRKAFRCPACAPKTRASLHSVSAGGYEFRLRGKEAIALEWILDNTTIKPCDVLCDVDGTPIIHYQDLTRTRKYLPDFWIEKRNLLVEVKDVTSIGLYAKFFYQAPEVLWATNCAKAQACIDAGYKFQMLVFDKNNERIKLPKDWHTYSHKRIVKWFNDFRN